MKRHSAAHIAELGERAYCSLFGEVPDVREFFNFDPSFLYEYVSKADLGHGFLIGDVVEEKFLVKEANVPGEFEDFVAVEGVYESEVEEDYEEVVPDPEAWKPPVGIKSELTEDEYGDLVQVKSIKGTTGAFSVDVEDRHPVSLQLVDGDAYHTSGTGYDAKLVKGVPRVVWESIIDPGKYWLVEA